jgi:hypothetical protein
MTAFPTYSTGTVAIGAGATSIVGTGSNWTGVNAMPGDLIVVAGNTVMIEDVTDTLHLVIDAWPYSAVAAGTAYSIKKNSPTRFVGGQAMADVSTLVGALNTDGFYFFVPPAASVPDPSYGNNGQYAFQATTGKLWIKSSGIWTFLGVYTGFSFLGAWNSATAYGINQVVTLGGSSYICILAHTNQTPPNATYWALLASKGDQGVQGIQGASYACTSATSFTIGTGSKAFTTQAGLAWLPGARARISSLAGAGANYMEGVATAYSGTTLTVNVSKIVGSGTDADWQISLAGDPGTGDLLSTNNLSDLTNLNTARDTLGALPVEGLQPAYRLTLSSGVALTTSDIAGATAIYLTPAGGSVLPIYDGTKWHGYFSGEVSIALDPTSGHTGYHAAGSTFDCFAIDNGGTIQLATGPAWATVSSRGTGSGTTELENFGGRWVNKNALVNARFGSASGNTVAVAARCATYVGSFFATAAGQATDTRQSRLLYNACLPAKRSLFRIEPTANWSYGSAAYRVANGNLSNFVQFLVGLVGPTVDLQYSTLVQAGAANVQVQISIGIGVPTPDLEQSLATISAASAFLPMKLSKTHTPAGLGPITYYMLESGGGTGAQSWSGSNAYTYLSGSVVM